MTDTTNPYQSPKFIDETGPREARVAPGVDVLAIIAWPVVFGLNMIVPLLFGWELTRDLGRIGLGAACAGLLLSGWLLCLFQPSIARKLILGSSLVALSQLFPVLQIIAGMLAYGVAEGLGLVVSGDGNPMGYISSEAGGFVVTLLVGSMLLIVAGALGLGLGLVLPRSWFQPHKDTGADRRASRLSLFEIAELKAKKSRAKR